MEEPAAPVLAAQMSPRESTHRPVIQLRGEAILVISSGSTLPFPFVSLHRLPLLSRVPPARTQLSQSERSISMSPITPCPVVNMTSRLSDAPADPVPVPPPEAGKGMGEEPKRRTIAWELLARSGSPNLRWSQL